VNVSATAGSAFKNSIAARGAAFGDLNNDGQVDAVIAVNDDAPVILRNNGTRNHWLGLSVSRIGARVIVTDSNGQKHFFEATSAGSYLSSNDQRIVVGLGKARGIRSIEVRWPNGRVQTITNPTIDRYIRVSQ
jgi:hypothetical protein